MVPIRYLFIHRAHPDNVVLTSQETTTSYILASIGNTPTAARKKQIGNTAAVAKACLMTI